MWVFSFKLIWNRLIWSLTYLWQVNTAVWGVTHFSSPCVKVISKTNSHTSMKWFQRGKKCYFPSSPAKEGKLPQWWREHHCGWPSPSLHSPVRRAGGGPGGQWAWGVLFWQLTEPTPLCEETRQCWPGTGGMGGGGKVLTAPQGSREHEEY